MFDALATDATLADSSTGFRLRNSSTAKVFRYEASQQATRPAAPGRGAARDWTGDVTTASFNAVSTSPDIQNQASGLDELLRSITNSSRFPFRTRIGKRLRDLYRMASEDDDERAKDINVEALQALIGFLKSAELRRPPKIGLTDEGTLTAEWEIAQNKRLLVHFLSMNSANFAIVMPAPRAPSKTVSVYGNAPIGSISAILNDNGAGVWI